MRAGKLVPHDLAVVLARLELCGRAPSLGWFLVLGLVVVIPCVRDGLCGVPLAVAELLHVCGWPRGFYPSGWIDW